MSIMGVKETVKAIIGPERISNIKGHVMHVVCSVRLGKIKLSLEGDRLSIYKQLSAKGYHVFRGYYDLSYMSEDQNKLLVHRLSKNATYNKSNSVQIGYYDLQTDKFCKVAESSAWCWQQGSRLRWHPAQNNVVLFNDVDKANNKYITRVVNAQDKQTIGKIDFPLYDLSHDFSYGLSVNFSRLQRLRPGYGYNYFDDPTKGIMAPEYDGLFKVDLRGNKGILLYSLKELADKGSVPDEYECYLNHISIAPDDQHFLFFLISCKSGVKGWNTVLFISDKEGTELKVLQKEDRVSHYCWIDNENIMVTCHKEDNSEYYCTFNIVSGAKKVWNIENLGVDGHPNVFGDDEFITDTYPRDNSLQRIRFFRETDKTAKTAMSIYHDYRLRGEKRCDLHPSVECGGKYISVDTTYRDGLRSVLVLKTKEQ